MGPANAIALLFRRTADRGEDNGNMRYFHSSSLLIPGADTIDLTSPPEKEEPTIAFCQDATESKTDDDGYRHIIGSAQGGSAIAFLVPYQAGKRHLIQFDLKPGKARRFRMEVHGFATRMRKAVAIISSAGDTIEKAEEVSDVTAKPLNDGGLRIHFTFVPFRTVNEWFYLFPLDAEDRSEGGETQFGWRNFTVRAAAHTTPFRSSAHQSAYLVGKTILSCQHLYFFRNSLHFQFEINRPGTRLTQLTLESPIPIEHCQWWSSDAPHFSAVISCGQESSPVCPKQPGSPIPSPALMDALGPDFSAKGHEVVALFRDYKDFSRISLEESDRVRDLVLHAAFDDGSTLSVNPMDVFRATLERDSWWSLVTHHLENSLPAAVNNRTFLEIGARGVASQAVRSRTPPGWQYLGIDAEKDNNVDLVADAHALSRHIEHGTISAIYSSEVMEHLLSPIAFVLEANKVLQPGGLFFAKAPFSWPLHAEPHDYWRFGPQSWSSLLNRHTGFEILEICEYEQASIVPEIPLMDGMTRMQHGPAPLLTGVVARKTSETTLEWNGWSDDLAFGRYDHV